MHHLVPREKVKPARRAGFYKSDRGSIYATASIQRQSLDCISCQLYLTSMTFDLAQHIELQDRARLRERFYGAARTVLARL